MKKTVALIIISFVLSMAAFAGVEWTSKITTEGTKKRDSNLVTAHIYSQGGDLKQEFKEVSKQDNYYIKDGYWLFKSDMENIYIVNNKEKSYVELSLDSLLQLTGIVGQLVKIKILDQSIDTEVLPKEKINGYSCNHLKLTTDYTMQMKIVFIKKTVKIHEVKDMWAAPGLKNFQDINKTFLKKDVKTGIEDLDKLIKERMEKEGNIGFPMKVITHTVQSNKKGKVMSDTTTTMEVSDIAVKDFPKSFFEIPPDYRKEETGAGK